MRRSGASAPEQTPDGLRELESLRAKGLVRGPLKGTEKTGPRVDRKEVMKRRRGSQSAERSLQREKGSGHGSRRLATGATYFNARCVR